VSYLSVIVGPDMVRVDYIAEYSLIQRITLSKGIARKHRQDRLLYLGVKKSLHEARAEGRKPSAVCGGTVLCGGTMQFYIP